LKNFSLVMVLSNFIVCALIYLFIYLFGLSSLRLTEFIWTVNL
jgi:uncharacterized MAPEG superfamily protein